MFKNYSGKEDNRMDTKNFGRKIAFLRKQKGLTQALLAEKINVSNKTISRWETGEGYPEISLLKPLAAALETTVDDLLSEEEESEAQSKPQPEAKSDSQEKFQKETNTESDWTETKKRKESKYEEIPIDVDALKKCRLGTFWDSLIIFNKITFVCLMTCVLMMAVHIVSTIITSGLPWTFVLSVYMGFACNIALLSSIVGLILGLVDCYKKQTKGCIVFGVISFIGRFVFPWLAVIVNILCI